MGRTKNILSHLIPQIIQQYQDYSLRPLPRRLHDFECCTFDHSDNSPNRVSRVRETLLLYGSAGGAVKGNSHSLAARSTISIELRMNAVICSASSGWRESSARS